MSMASTSGGVWGYPFQILRLSGGFWISQACEWHRDIFRLGTIAKYFMPKKIFQMLQAQQGASCLESELRVNLGRFWTICHRVILHISNLSMVFEPFKHVDGFWIYRRTTRPEAGLQMRLKVTKLMSNWCRDDQFYRWSTQGPGAAAQRSSLCSHHPTSPPLPISTLLIHLPLHGSDMGIHIAWIGWEVRTQTRGRSQQDVKILCTNCQKKVWLLVELVSEVPATRGKESLM